MSRLSWDNEEAGKLIWKLIVTQRNSGGLARRYSEKWSDSVCISRDSRQAFMMESLWVVREGKNQEVPQRFGLSNYRIKGPFWSMGEWSEVQMQIGQM